jgi:hypothetical protein
MVDPSYFGIGAIPVGFGDFGLGENVIYLTQLGCNGTEEALDDCPRGAEIGHNYCRHFFDAGVICFGKLVSSICTLSGTIIVSQIGFGGKPQDDNYYDSVTSHVPLETSSSLYQSSSKFQSALWHFFPPNSILTPFSSTV